MNFITQPDIASRLLHATADSYGEAFLSRLVEALGQVLGVRYAMVARTDAVRGQARSVVLWANGALAPNMVYDLAHTPCANVVAQGMCYYPCGIQAQFPKDQLLVDMEADSYLGVALHASDGTVLGLFEVIDDKPFADDALVRGALSLFAGRVQAELLRQDAETERNETLARLREAAYRDGLTRLLSRQGLLDKLEERLEEDGVEGAVLVLLDIDRFAEVNYTLGAEAGNQLLLTLAEQLHALPPPCVAARLYGDVFAVYGPENRSGLDALARALGPSVRVAGYKIPLHLQMGQYRLDADCRDPSLALTRASMALAKAKARTDMSRVEFVPDMETRQLWRQKLLYELRRALDRDALEVWYQPQLSFETGAVTGFEALARWPDGYSPAEFIPLAEEVGLVPQIGRFVLKTACRDFLALKARYPGLQAVSVNISPAQLMQPDFVTETLEFLRGCGLPPESVELEVTESRLLEDVGQAGQLLSELAGAGLGLALDDFGTGYSSLSYLSGLPLDRLKIDRSFVAELGSEHADAIIGMILSLARELQLTVVAEGVETQAQATILKALGCQVAQGFYYAKPMPLAVLTSWLEARG